ncbi:hypothetical protein MKEN_00188200 [Mycena kentingensis (nom. inval.)]|nr:hypothetical protein MKEN_00188200 [Mycena kentingensis (nom. inval.)]
MAATPPLASPQEQGLKTAILAVVNLSAQKPIDGEAILKQITSLAALLPVNGPQRVLSLVGSAGCITLWKNLHRSHPEKLQEFLADLFQNSDTTGNSLKFSVLRIIIGLPINELERQWCRDQAKAHLFTTNSISPQDLEWILDTLFTGPLGGFTTKFVARIPAAKPLPLYWLTLIQELVKRRSRFSSSALLDRTVSEYLGFAVERVRVLQPGPNAEARSGTVIQLFKLCETTGNGHLCSGVFARMRAEAREKPPMAVVWKHFADLVPTLAELSAASSSFSVRCLLREMLREIANLLCTAPSPECACHGGNRCNPCPITEASSLAAIAVSLEDLISLKYKLIRRHSTTAIDILIRALSASCRQLTGYDTLVSDLLRLDLEHYLPPGQERIKALDSLARVINTSVDAAAPDALEELFGSAFFKSTRPTSYTMDVLAALIPRVAPRFANGVADCPQPLRVQFEDFAAQVLTTFVERLNVYETQQKLVDGYKCPARDACENCAEVKRQFLAAPDRSSFVGKRCK